MPEFVTKTQPTIPFVGDSGSGGKPGAVPAPAAGDGVLRLLSADGTWKFPPLLETQFDEVEIDATTGASPAAPDTLLSVSITPKDASHSFEIHFTASGEADVTGDRQISFQLWYGLSGAEAFRRATYLFSDRRDGEAGSCALTLKVPAVGAGQHTFDIRWGVLGSGNARIRAVSLPLFEHGSLLVREVSV